MKKAIVLLLALFLLMGTVTVPVSATDAVDEPNAEIADWSYDNSILVKVKCLENRTFAPADFPEIDCKEVWIIEKVDLSAIFALQLWYEYELVLFLNDSDIERAIKDVLANDLVVSAYGNSYVLGATTNSTLSLKSNDRSLVRDLYLPVGGVTNLYVYNISSICEDIVWNSVEFCFFTDKVPSNNINQYSFLSQGIFNCKPIYSSISYKKYRGSLLYNEIGDVDCHIEYARVVNNLSKLNYINEVSISSVLYNSYATDLVSASIESEVIGKEFPYEAWSIRDDDVAEITLSGGYTDEYNRTFNQTAMIIANDVGDTQVVVTRIGENNGIDFGLKAVWTIHVFEPADVNEDGEADSLDAAAILKHDAGVEQLSNDQLEECDMNGDGEVDSLDAVLLLRYDAGIYN